MVFFSYIKSFFLIICTIYLCRRLLNIRNLTKHNLLVDIFFSLSLPLLICIVQEYFLSFRPVMMAFFISGYTMLYYRQTFRVSVITSIISIALSYLLFFFSASLVFWIERLLSLLISDRMTIDLISVTATGIVQIFLVNLLLSFQRLQKGMPFLYSEKFTDIGAAIGIFVTSCIILGTSRELVPTYYGIVLICGMVLFLWWLNQLQVTYRERHSANVTERLDQEVAQLTEENNSLRQKNFELSRVIHADNKMIPALELAFREALDGAAFTDPKKEQSVRTTLEFIGAKAAERNLELIQYESAHTGLPPTGVPAVDIAVQAFARRAANQGVDFAFTPLASAKHLTDLFIPANDLHTLLMDLLDNALLAVKHTGRKNMLLNIGIVDDVYFLAVYDSGAAFPTDTIRRMGLERVTSRADDGGSGIGLMTTFDILRNCKASFVLDETIDNSLYAKAVSILFDGRGETRIISDRKEILVLDQDRRDIQFFPGANAVLQA